MKLGFQREGDLMEELKKQFTEDMRRLCIEIKNASHNPSRFIQMLTDGDSVV